MEIIKIKRDECPINIIAENPEKFNGKIVKVERDMVERLIDEAVAENEKNMTAIELKGQDKWEEVYSSTQINVRIPGEVETNLSFIEKMKFCGRNVSCEYYLIDVQADDIKGCSLSKRVNDENKEVYDREKGYCVIPVISFEYEKEHVAESDLSK